MSRQLIFTAAACGLAACVLIATLVLSPPVEQPKKPDRPILDPNARFQAGPDPLTTGNNTPQNIAPSGEVDRYYLRRFNSDRNQLTVLSGERARPKPNGVVDIDKIIAHIHLIPGRRVVEITGPRGTLVAPENNPESGSLSGGVVITIFESPENEVVNLKPDSPHATLRLFLDEVVHFNLELGTVESEGPVHLTTSRVDFQGNGLNIIYNERRRRINRLEITQGRTMRFNPKAGRELTATTKPKNPNKALVIADYYKAVLDTGIQIRTEQAAIDAKRMEILFSLENRSEKEEPVKELGHLLEPRPASPDDALNLALHLHHTSIATSHTTQSPDLSANDPAKARSMMVPSAEDVVIHWTGGLLMEPLDAKPDELAGPDDTMITLLDAVRIRSARQETIAADRVEYLSSAARVRITGQAQAPAVITSPQLGRVEVMDLVIHQNEGTGRITGPGAIAAVGDVVALDALPALDADGARKLPPGLTLAWKEAVDLRFHVKPPVDKATIAPGPAAPGDPATPATTRPKNENPTLNPVARLDALKDALFQGTVEVRHPQVDLNTDQLAIAMTQPDADGQDPQEIKATGQVRATARGSGDQPPLDIASRELTITFTTPPVTPATPARKKPKAQPTRMLATGDVKTQQGSRELSAGVLDVALAAQAKDPAKPRLPDDAAKPDDFADRLAIDKLLAREAVRITTQSPRMVVTADRLDGDAVTGILQLFGTAQMPAKVEREGDSLTGPHITLRESDQFVSVTGPGSAQFVTSAAPPDAPEAPKPGAPADAAAPPKAPQAPQRLTVHWLKAMDFNNTTGLANFNGEVVARSERGIDLTRFQSGQLTLLLDPIDPSDKRPGLKDLITADARPAVDPAVAGHKETKDKDHANKDHANKDDAKDKLPARAVRKIIATEKVVFEAEQWADRVGGNLATRFRLTGPLLTFDNQTGKLIVTGAGTMQLEDYRPDKAKDQADTADAKAADAKAAGAKPDSPVAFVGRGVTLFLWESSLAIDATHNDVRMDKQVRMIQQPSKGSDIQMRCDQLIADFQSTGGLNSWLTGKAGEPRLDNVTASGGLVILYQKQTLRGDQLYYTGNKQMAIISAEEGRMAELDTEQATLPARQFRWFLDRDRIVAEEPGAIRAKVQR